MKIPYTILFLSIFIGLQGCGGKSTSDAVKNTAISSQPIILSDSSEVSLVRSKSSTTLIPHALKTSGEYQQATLQWSALSQVSNYTVYWSNTLPFDPQKATAEQTNTESFTHQVTPNTTYYYQVSGWINGEESPVKKITVQTHTL
jgi:hypothetical protein